MPPSQLKQLKASLRDSGVIRQPQSKKKRRQDEKDSVKARQSRVQRNATLAKIREQFNPFEIKAPSRNAKFDVTTRDGSLKAGNFARPGVTKSLGEERRRETLLKELHSRNKIGSIMDRRFGENDPTMTPEERAAERFARESQRKMRKENMFNLEDDDEEELELTHGGRSLSFGDAVAGDDFAENDISGEESSEDEESSRKRKRALATEDEVDDMEGMASEDDEADKETEPLRKKTKAEVMKEVIAKSKLYKYERQKAKEDDDDLRAELDKGLPEIFDLMRGVKPAPSKQPEAPKEDAAMMNPDRAALLNGKDRTEADIEYDKRLKQMAFDKKSAPTDRTKTEEERAQEEAERLKRLELERLRRMRGDEDSESEAGRDEDEQDEEEGADFIPDDAKAFGLTSAVETEPRRELDVEDEDDFIIDDDLVDMDSNADLSFEESDEEMGGLEDEESEDEGLMDDEFTKSLKNLVGTQSGSNDVPTTGKSTDALAYTYPCPQTHDEFLAILKDTTARDIPVIVQRIRALYHPRLHSDNKVKLGVFSKVLVEHVAYMANQHGSETFNIVENLLRHIHSMAKTNSEPVAHAFRDHLRRMATERPLSLLPADLVILTGVMTVFPTSDHFHPVVTPANLCIARYLGQSTVSGAPDLVAGAYLATLALEYQTLAKRYMPEFVNYCLNALCLLSPTPVSQQVGFVLMRESKESLRLKSSSIDSDIHRIGFWDIIADDGTASSEDLKINLINTFISLLDAAADLWSDKSAFTETFTPAKSILKHLKKSFAKSASSKPLSIQLTTTLHKLNTHLTQSHHHRRPLLLHNHRPLAIKQSIPKFEEDFNPDKHYDPNRERAELNKLKAEHKRERKGAMRELRKDANFVAREQLREKKEKDAAYEKKYRRLIAEIQGEEGREAKAYEREKKWRQGKK
ncbi:rRNA maturation protein (Nop14), putative [Talaromyces stipitatus ATCC 10500]|uniref:rRNA maturation protein (Nop14), putative n=1 Tax=Talaromyces stipitatus (strain ATCC 10500 / CBS 375.48 / QM 6759 / NRRL 1006) TaxID=441959 RepID=B8MHP1_TALSN|nr:rRNA maturation protein (Nop14), putative [Talaromyces stipitatus ATCC 10500]EED16022.1 rRNA maturation protein (Nop14), putative [Talaromyces stipitatus ATCC 10500]